MRTRASAILFIAPIAGILLGVREWRVHFSAAARHATAVAPPGAAEDGSEEEDGAEQDPPPPAPRGGTVDAAGAEIEQTSQGTRAPLPVLESFDGLGNGFNGPQGTANLRNPSDNSLAVGPDHVVQIVNLRMAIFTKKGSQFGTTGHGLYGPVVTNTIFAGFGGQCEKQISGDAVVRYDQLAERWLFVLPVFRLPPGEPNGPYSMCHAVSVWRDPRGPYHRYEFKRPLFPDYPRPAIWPDGYYVPTSTGDTVIQKHICVADRARMLEVLPATEQCVIVDGAIFLNNADIDGHGLPPLGSPNIVIAAGGAQLHGQFSDDGLYAWQLHVDWENALEDRADWPGKNLGGTLSLPLQWPTHQLRPAAGNRAPPRRPG